MMDFVVCDDDSFFRKSIVKVIDKMLINSDINYKIHEFMSYTKDFEKLINKKKPKIYILDIEIKNSISGIDIARKIRKCDWDSIIIIVTSHSELSFQVMKAQIMLLDFISKFDNFESSLKVAIDKALELIGKKQIIKVENKGVSYIVYIKDILYIERDTVDRKCFIKTGYGTVPINKTLNELKVELGDDFYMCHRSCLVNLNNISKIDWKENIIYFYDNNSTPLLARDRKKGLREYVGN